MSKLTPHLSLLDKALKAQGVELKRGALVEVMAKAFGFHNSHELSAVAERGKLPAPPTVNATEAHPLTIPVYSAAITDECRRFTTFLVAGSKSEINRQISDYARENWHSSSTACEHDLSALDEDKIVECFFADDAFTLEEEIFQIASPFAINPKKALPSASLHTMISISGQNLNVYAEPDTDRLFAVPADQATAVTSAGPMRLPSPQGERPVVKTYFDISTIHISQPTRDWLSSQGSIAAQYLNTGDPEPVINIGETMYGFWIYAGDYTSPTFDGEIIPQDLLDILAFARKLHANFVLFDSDGPEYDDMIKFD